MFDRDLVIFLQFKDAHRETGGLIIVLQHQVIGIAGQESVLIVPHHVITLRSISLQCYLIYKCKIETYYHLILRNVETSPIVSLSKL